MTAKSETVGVVAYLSPDREGRNGGKPTVMAADECVMLRRVLEPMGHEFIPLVPESALAELKAESQLLNAQLDSLKTEIEIVAGTLQRTAHALSVRSDQHANIISGLEALAGEWENPHMPDSYRIHSKELRALIPAAANTESEEGHGRE